MTHKPLLSDTTEYSGPIKKGERRLSKWLPEFDDALRADWNNGVSISEFARRFGYKGRTNGIGTVRKHAIRLGLLERSQ